MPITHLLQAVSRGEPAAQARLMELVYGELRAMARSRIEGEAPGGSLQASDLVHDTYLHVLGGQQPTFENRRHFFGAAAIAMQRILVNHARQKQSIKRGGDRNRVPFDRIELPRESRSVDLVALDEVLPLLSEDNARCRRLGGTILGLEGLEIAQGTIDTNVLFINVTHKRLDAPMIQAAMEEEGTLILALRERLLRMVTHRQVTDADVDRAAQSLQRVMTDS